MTGLPTPEEMLTNAERHLNVAYRALGDAADWLRSDWRPAGSALTDEQAARKARMFQAINEAKTAIRRAKGGTA